MLIATPLLFREANTYVALLHRHHKPVVGCKFVIGASDESGKLVGVAIAGRPVCRRYDHRKVIEVNRLCTDGTRNVCSFLYSRCARIASEFGYSTILTYILASEPGTSLLAAGWENDGIVEGSSWSVPSRKRVDKHPTVDKVRYIKRLNNLQDEIQLPRAA